MAAQYLNFRLNLLKDSDWNKIIEVGSQTSVLNFHDVSVIKTVIKKLKQGKQIDIKRLSITNDCLNKMKKFGMKY